MKRFLPIVTLSCVVALTTTSPAQTSATPEEAAPPPAAAGDASSALATASVVMCHDVQDRAPVEPGESFASDVGQLCCFSNVTGAAEPVQVYHRWYVGDRMVLEIPISVKAANWRCWSRKTIVPSWQGPCRVDVATESGDVIGSVAFTLTSPAETPQS